MGTLRYPRPGQRIAPDTLRDILDVPVPAEFEHFAKGRFDKLSDLDERIWDYASAKDCEVLSKLVLHHVHRRAANLPVVVKCRALPKIRSNIALKSLGVGVRTFHCLEKRLGGNLLLLNTMCVRDLMRIANFGSNCLVDLLVAVESVLDIEIQHEQLEMEALVATAEELIPAGELPSEIRVEISRFPRKGHRIAPRTLAHFLDVPAKDRRMDGVKLLDLDESVWDKFEYKTCHKLALEVISRVRTFRSALRGQLGGTRLPMPRTKGKPTVLQLQKRTFNCLNKAGLLENPARLAETTFRELLEMAGFGDICLVDLLCALETQSASGHRTSQEVVVAAQRLAKLKEAASIRPDDPRFGLMIQSLAVPGENLEQVAEEIAHSTTCASSPRSFAQRLNDILQKVRASKQLQLEDELEELLTFEPHPRNREMTASLLGWDGKGTHTLEEIGLRHGTTRERVRQVTKRLIETLKAKRPFLPVLDRVLQAIPDQLPCSVERIESVLAERKLIRARFQFWGIISAAEITSRHCPFAIEDVDGEQYAVPHGQQGVAKTVIQLTRKSVSHWGVATIEDIAAQVSDEVHRDISPQFVEAVLITQQGFSWLDKVSGWFWLKSTARNALLNQIQKVTAVASRIHVSELRAAVSRHHRREGFAPPQRVLIALCAQTEGYAIEGDSVIASPQMDYLDVVSDTESIMVAVLRAHGPVMQRPKFEELCLRKGLHRDTFYIHLTYSPVIARYSRGVYGLPGAEVPPGLAASLVETRKKTRVLADYGWLPDGKIFLFYKLSRGSIANGILSVPASMKSYLQGEFRILIGDGQPAGRLVIKESQAWGLGPFFRRRGGEPGDHFQIVFDTKQQVASVGMREAEDDEGTG